MGFIYKKNAGIKYTDLCIYIDENVSKIVNPGENPDIENTIYNYLWLLVKALAIKKNMFQNFQDYDPYAFYAANRLFFALRKNQLNQGKTIKGKKIRPIKSCLNYTKALLYPMKIEYQRESYREIIDEEFVSKKFNAVTFKNRLIESIRQDQTNPYILQTYIQDTLSGIGNILDEVLKKLPFSKDSLEYKKIKISILLNSINSLKSKKRLNIDIPTITLWKLPKSMSSYLRVLLKEFHTKLASELIDCYQSATPTDAMAETVLNCKEGADYDYENNGD